MSNEKEKLIEAMNDHPLMLLAPATFDNSSYHEIKVLIPRDIEDDVDSIEVDIRFKEKANCKKRFTDREGIHYITGYKQEGTTKKGNVEQED